ncbi:MAG: hypothetical protein QOE22_632 [Candidatus Parcubacteria bacterium]|jgi:hypothetical protein|nr:hypothetical protein [Candidatus Parcubacteria bacterium]
MEKPNAQAPDAVRPWYKKKRYIAPLALVALYSGVSAFSGPSASTPIVPQNVIPVDTAIRPAIDPPTAQANEPVEAPARESNLSNDNHYTNVDGNTVHSPAYSDTGCAAAGASAECRDGTCSFSQNRRGTCSHHGGVAEWL